MTGILSKHQTENDSLSSVEGLQRETSRFTAKEWDEETKLYYMSARYQNLMTSRWMSAEPAGSQLINPMRKGFSFIESQNWYSYVSNNPVKYTDPTGLSGKIDLGDNPTGVIDFDLYAKSVNDRIEPISNEEKQELFDSADIELGHDVSSDDVTDAYSDYSDSIEKVNEKRGEISDLMNDYRKIVEGQVDLDEKSTILTSLGIYAGSQEVLSLGSPQTLMETLHDGIGYGSEMIDMKSAASAMPGIIEGKIADLQTLQFASNGALQTFAGKRKRWLANGGN